MAVMEWIDLAQDREECSNYPAAGPWRRAQIHRGTIRAVPNELIDWDAAYLDTGSTDVSAKRIASGLKSESTMTAAKNK
jgi:hypothetical protein